MFVVSTSAEPLLEGRVRLSDGSPVAGAQVVLFDVADLAKGPVRQATTDETGQFALPLAASAALGLPQGFALGPNYPNPFNPSTIIPYHLSAPSPVRLEVFNILGQHIAMLVDEEQQAGSYRARWEGTDAAGRAAASGVYFYRLTVAGAHQTGRMVLVDGQVGVPLGGASVAAVPLAAGSTGSYGLVVSGEGLVAYVDAAFSVAVGQGPVDLVVEAQPKVRGKVGPVDSAVETQSKVWRTEVPRLEGLLGDVDNNGQVDMADGLLVAMHRVDPAVSLPNHGQIGLGDVDCNGRVERADVDLLASYVANPSDAAVSSRRIGQRGGYSLDPVTEMVWGSILGTEQQDATVARLLDEVPVLVSGVFEIDGRDYLYLGIDRDYYTQHGGEHLYTTLKKRFPITPLFVEASDGVQQQADRRTRSEPESPNQEETRPAGSGAGKVTSSDRDVLVALFEATDGNNWTNNTHWLSDKPLADWFGVTTDENGRVTGLDLRVNGLHGSIPQGLSQLQNLTYLNLRGNQLSGSIPQGLGQLQNLTYLYLYDNQLSGSIPQSLGQLQNLQVLNLRDNQLSGSIPPALGQLQNLIYLVLRVNGLSGSIPPALGQLQNLQVLNLRVNQLSGPLPASLVNLTHLEWLVMEDTQLCVPTDAGFQVWLEGIENKRGVVNCTGDGDASASDTPEDEPATRPDLTIPSITASPTNPESEGLITMQITVHNRGAGSASSEIIWVYRHAARTANPTVNGARIVQTARSGSLAAGASATHALSTVVPSVTSATTYYYYACVDAATGEQQTDDNCSLDPAEVRVGGGSVAVGVGSGLVLSLSATPDITESGATTALRLTVRNDGTASAGSETIRLYRHTSRSSNPTSGSRLATTATTGSLTAGAQVVKTIVVTVPSVTSDTTYYYYACVTAADGETNTGDNCSGPAEVRVRAPAPVEEEVVVTNGECGFPVWKTPMGGDGFTIQDGGIDSGTDSGGGTYGSCAATITLGGLETTDGTRGFVVSAHTVDYGPDNVEDLLVGHRSHRYRLKHLLGKVLKMPWHTTRTEGGKKVIAADATFVRYPQPQRSDCSRKWTWQDDGEAFCLDENSQDDYIDRVNPLTIRGKNGDVYQVIGSKNPTAGLKVTYSGSRSGPHGKEGSVASGKTLVYYGTGNRGGLYQYVYRTTDELGGIDGDSGSPIYTVPGVNKTTHIVGVYAGSLFINRKPFAMFSSWNDVADAFDLKPITQ